ncbi:MAG: hypothetical protein K6G63_02065 [Eubacterium sp.]|nr:hypothetical protein [Eubacterium sp.]
MAEKEEAQKSISDLKKARKNSKIKLLLAFFLVAIMLILSALAWFSMNESSEVGDMNMMATGPTFEILTDSEEGVYADKYKQINENGTLWLVDESSNFSNLESESSPPQETGSQSSDEEVGIDPGSKGKMKFLIRATASDSVKLDLSFFLKGVREDADTKELSVMSKTEDEELLKFLNMHILLFENYNSSTNQYSGLISNLDDLKRVLKNRTFSRDNEEYTYIYWIWPTYLSDIVGDNTIIAEDDFDDVIDYIAENKDGFFYRLNRDVEQIKSDLKKKKNYPMYSEYFDKVDLEIGNSIDYVILSLNAAEAIGGE